MVALDILWASYTVGGAPLGAANPNYSILFNINTTGPNSLAKEWTLQSVYIDNEQVNFPVYVYFNDTQFTVSCPANSAGWYPVYTNSRQGLVSAVGMDTLGVAQGQRTRVFFTDVLMVPSLDQENQTAVMQGLASQQITLGGTGGSVISAVIGNQGSGYTNGTLAISGGGGAGATAHGAVDAYGRFTSITIDNPGTGYTGPPVVTATAAQTLIPAWNGATIYGTGAVVGIAGDFLYTAINSDGGINGKFPPSNPSFWSNTGILYQAVASFLPQVSPITGGASITQSGNYGTMALGDQTKSYYNSQSGIGGPFQDNLFGTPFNSGFIYLTNIFVNQLSSGAGGKQLWNMKDTANNVLLNFATLASANGGVVYENQRCNIKIPATSQWQLQGTFQSALFDILHAFTWTYSQQ